MQVNIIFIERQPPPKGYWGLVGECLRAIEWPDPVEKEFLATVSTEERILEKFGLPLFRTSASWPWGTAPHQELAFHLGHELVRQWHEGAFNKRMSRPGWLSKWLSLNL